MRRGKEKSRRLPGAALGVLLTGLVLLMSACSGEQGPARVIFTTGLRADEVFRIGQASCSLSEASVYLTTTQNQYENIFGREIWEKGTLEERVKENVLASLAQIKTMSLLAEEKGVKLSDRELEAVKLAARAYFDSLSDVEKQAMDVSLETIESLYEQEALSDKVYRLLIEGVNPEISDDEARTVKAAYIFISKSTVNAAKTAESLREKAAEEGCDFMSLASENTHAASTTLSLRREAAVGGAALGGEGSGTEAPGPDAGLVEAAFDLATDQVSPVVETEDGFYVLKCLSTLDREETDANKVRMVEQRRKEVFAREYESFVADLPRQLNEKLWQEVSLIHEENVDTSDFFEVYSEYIGRAETAE